MPEGEQTPGTNTTAGGSSAARPKGDDAVTLALTTHHRNPVRIAKVMQREIDRLTALVERGAAKPGEVVLSADDAKAWQSYKALGKPEELGALKGERDTLKQAETARAETEARETLFVETAQSLGWNEAAARKAARALAVKLERREDEFDVTTNGQTTKAKKPVAYVLTGEGAQAKAERLDAFIAREHDLYLPALTTPATGANGTPALAPRATPYPAAPLTPSNGGQGDDRAQLETALRAESGSLF